MTMFIKICMFMRAIFDEKEIAIRAAEIGQTILDARFLRVTGIPVKMRVKVCGLIWLKTRWSN